MYPNSQIHYFQYMIVATAAFLLDFFLVSVHISVLVDEFSMYVRSSMQMYAQILIQILTYTCMHIKCMYKSEYLYCFTV